MCSNEMFYTPCRISECYYSKDEAIQLFNTEGNYQIKGVLIDIWKLLDGKNTIANIASIICNKYKYENIQLCAKEILKTLLLLEEKQFIILNWNPALLNDME